MNSVFKKIKAGDMAKISLNDKNIMTFLAVTRSGDEIIFMGHHSLFNKEDNFQFNKTLIGLETKCNKVQLKKGDRLVVNLIDGDQIEMFVSYTVGIDGLALGVSKISTYSSMKWLFKLMDDFYLTKNISNSKTEVL